jgi:hypothetical protein
MNTWIIIARQRRNGGARSYFIFAFGRSLADFSGDTSFWGLFFRSTGRHPKKYFLRQQQDHKSGHGKKFLETLTIQ